MAAPYTATTDLANLVQTAYDRKVRLALRSQPTFRAFADTKPVQQTQPGSSVVFNIHTDLSPATTPLNEVTDPTGVSVANTTPITVTLNEYGNYTVATKALREFALDSGLDSNIANLIAFNQVDSVDRVIEAIIAGTTNVVREIGGSLSTAAVTGVTGTDTLKARDIRYAVTKMRSASVVPVRGSQFAVVLHPEVSADLRAETGADGWRVPANYGNVIDGIKAGEIGEFEGAFYVESPRVTSAQAGSGSGGTQTRVFNTYVMGQEALAEAVAEEFHTVADGVIVDPLRRKMAIGWYGIAGWNLFRPESLWKIQTAASGRPNV